MKLKKEHWDNVANDLRVVLLRTPQAFDNEGLPPDAKKAVRHPWGYRRTRKHKDKDGRPIKTRSLIRVQDKGGPFWKKMGEAKRDDLRECHRQMFGNTGYEKRNVFELEEVPTTGGEQMPLL